MHRDLGASSAVSGSDAGRRRLRVVALGGGHGLYASLSALRLLDAELTAVVTVADDGGSSGRIRRELGVLPPGDLRMALAALAGRRPTSRAVVAAAAAPVRRQSARWPATRSATCC